MRRARPWQHCLYEILQSIDQQGNVRPFLKAERVLTSWDTLYWRLRIGFDGAGGEFFEAGNDEIFERKQELKKRGKGFYDTGKRVVGISAPESGVIVKVIDVSTQIEQKITADLIIGADGPNSVVRDTFMPKVRSQQAYAGYVAWRGVVPENQVSPATRQIFQKNISHVLMPGEHIIM